MNDSILDVIDVKTKEDIINFIGAVQVATMATIQDTLPSVLKRIEKRAYDKGRYSIESHREAKKAYERGRYSVPEHKERKKQQVRDYRGSCKWLPILYISIWF